MDVLILTGACGVGKSTISKEWARIKKGAIIECDYFTEWIFNPDFPRWNMEEEKFVANLAALTSLEYLRNNMSVAIENVWTPIGLTILKNKLEQEPLVTNIQFVWLYCQSEENHRRDELRIPENQMKERVDIVNKQLADQIWPSYVHKIDSTLLNIKETIQKIENLNTIY